MVPHHILIERPRVLPLESVRRICSSDNDGLLKGDACAGIPEKLPAGTFARPSASIPTASIIAPTTPTEAALHSDD